VDDRGIVVRFPDVVRDFSLLKSVPTRSGEGSRQPHIQRIPREVYRGYSNRVVKLTTHNHLEPRLRTSGAMVLLPIRFHTVHTDTFTFTFYSLHGAKVFRSLRFLTYSRNSAFLELYHV